MIKDTIVWTLSTAFILTLKTNEIKYNRDLWRVMKNSISLMFLIEYILNFSSFQLWFELIIFPVFYIFNKINHIEINNNSKYFKVNKTINKLIYVLYFVYSLYISITQYQLLLSIESIKLCLLLPILTLLYLPYVYITKLFVMYEWLFKTKLISLKGSEKRHYKFKILQFCLLNLDKLYYCNTNIKVYSGQPTKYLVTNLNLTLLEYKNDSFNSNDIN